MSRMTVAAFCAWQPPERADHRWQLVDGEPVCRAPAAEDHGAIRSEVAYLLTTHLWERRPAWRVIAAPGIVPRVAASTNLRIPDIGVTGAPPSGAQVVAEPILLVEVRSTTDEALTCLNVWAYATIPSVVEILLLDGARIGAELLRRGPDGAWPEGPEVVAEDGDVDLASIGLRASLRAFYRGTSLLPW